MANLQQGDTPQAWVLYDNQCGFCSRWVEFWGPTLAKRNIGIAGLQEAWVVDRLRLTEPELLHDIRLLTKERRVISGADVYLYVTRRIWWAWPFYALFSLPGLNQLLHFGYRWFALNRHRISTTCGLHPAPTLKSDSTPSGGARK
jgi:predicted DCC family thiol-disulfide oxidoreductase YuxK